jgi:Permuted papain-like amidase enzyme, YaeF/YiiX, C92 family
MYRWILLLLCLPALATAQDFTFRSGDLIFQDLNCGELCDAIEVVTAARMGHHYSHVGIVAQQGDSLVVYEAIGATVHQSPLYGVLGRSVDSLGRPRVIVGRVRARYQQLIPTMLTYCRAQLGKPYDQLFTIRDDSYYCSELVYDAYKQANGGKPFFKLRPMTFRQPGSKTYFPAWVQYYKELYQPIPEGQLGCNPGGIANDHKIEIVKVYY